MARTKISEFSATAADNTDIDGIDIAEGCAPSGINNAIRTLMADLKNMQTGASGDTFTFASLNATTANIDGGTIDGATIGGSSAAPVSSTNLAYTGTLTGGTGIVNIGSGQIYKDASGNVGIGTSSPSDALTLVSGNLRIQKGTPELRFRSAGDVKKWYIGANISDSTDGGLIIGTGDGVSGGTARITIDSSGNVGIGTSSPNWKLTVSDGTVQGGLVPFSNTLITGTVSAHPYVFYTTNAERMRIDASGNLLIGKTTTSYQASGAYIQQNGTGWFTADDGPLRVTAPVNAGLVAFYRKDTGGYMGGITNGASNTVVYNTGSDYRLKEQVAPMTGALAKNELLNPVTFKWKTDGSDGQGFIAHELQAVFPDAVTGEKDAVDDEGKPVYQGVDTSFLVGHLVACVKELTAELNNVKAELAAMKGSA